MALVCQYKCLIPWHWIMRSILLQFKSNTCGVLEKFSSLVWLNTSNNQLMFRLLGLFLENPFEAHRSKLPLHDCPIKKLLMNKCKKWEWKGYVISVKKSGNKVIIVWNLACIWLIKWKCLVMLISIRVSSHLIH